MKKIRIVLALICFFNLIDLAAQGGVQIIEKPDFDLGNTAQFQISKVELSSEETKLHLQWDMPQGWWLKYGRDAFIRNPETGEKFFIVSIENENFNEEIHMDPDGGHHSVFVFPPLEKGIKKIDYNNQFWGLYLNEEKEPDTDDIPESVKKWLDTELAKNTKEPIKNYEEDQFFSKEPGKIIGYIKGYDTRLGFDTGIYYASNELTREDYPITLEIQPDGRFEADIPLIHPVRSYIKFNHRLLFFYLEPGQTLGMILDWEDFLTAEHYRDRFYPQKTIEFKGNLAEINSDLSQFEFDQFNYDDFKEKSLTLSAADFKDYAFDIQKENKLKLDAFLQKQPVSDQAELIYRNENKLSGVVMVMNYLMNRSHYQREKPENQFLKEKIKPEYYDFLTYLPLNSQALLVNQRFSEFINRFEYADPLNFQHSYRNFVPEISQLEYFEEQNIDLSEKEKELLKPQDTITEEFRTAFAELRKEYSNVFEDYIKKYYEPFKGQQGIDFMAKWLKKDSVLTSLNLKNDLIYDITKIRGLKFELANLISEKTTADSYWEKLSATIENDFLKQEGKRLIQNNFPDPKENLDNMGSVKIAAEPEVILLPDGKAKNMFYEIADQYKGKILFIDFWATTCGPCVGNIKRMKETREKYKDHPDFDFVFITDEAQSPSGDYNEFIQEQNLENVHRVDTDVYNRFRELFQFNGIPRYVVLNKKGELIDGNFEMYRFSMELPGILEKYK